MATLRVAAKLSRGRLVGKMFSMSLSDGGETSRFAILAGVTYHLPPITRSPLPWQVMFSMTGLLAKFGMIMLLVMLGFVTSFYSLYKETTAYGVVRQRHKKRRR